MAAWWTPRRLLAAALAAVVAGTAVALAVGLRGSGTGTGTGGAGTAAGQPVLGFVRVDRAAPPVTLPRLAGRGTISLAVLAGEPIVVSFWSSSCDICQSETRALVHVAAATKGRVRFLGIDTLDLRGPGLAFAARYHIPYLLGFDPQGAVEARYRLAGLPTTFFLAPSGHRIIGVNTGALTVRALTGILRELYGKAA
jgi:thiol-disulfide isomerase/thioredoxin